MGHYELGACVVMANHVHLLIRPLIAPDRLLKLLKGATAREANRLLGRTGEPFWQKESYDHYVRNRMEFERIRIYIEANPVKAGLVRNAEDYLDLSLRQGRVWNIGGAQKEAISIMDREAEAGESRAALPF